MRKQDIVMMYTMEMYVESTTLDERERERATSSIGNESTIG